MKICGYNKDFRLGDKPNTKSAYGYPCITPPFDSHLEISNLLSFSAFGDHSIWITKDGRGYAIGSNESGQVIGTIDQKIYENEILIEIEDKSNHKYQFISAVCGNNYTLYLVSSTTDGTSHLVYSHSDINLKTPLFLNINSHAHSKYLFGGSELSAVIDSEGQIFIIQKTVITSPESSIESTVLPFNEKAVSIAFCDSFIVALSESGRLFESPTEKINFSLIKEIEGNLIVEISGTCKHCLAVSKDGKVFGRGSNVRGQLGLGKERSNFSEFTEISSLSKHRIISASAGLFHSLFITSEGKVLACGSCGNGQLLLSSEPSKSHVYTPIETTVASGASFAITGLGISCVFVGCKAPRNTPNRTINESERMIQLENENILLTKELLKQKAEIERLKQRVSKDKEEEVASFEILDAETIHSLREIREIGSGGGGRVFEVAKEEKYALKVMSTSDYSVEKQRQFIGEYEKLNILRHPNIVRAFGIFLSDEKKPPSILLEFCPTDLQKALKSSSFTKVEVAKIVYQIAEAMNFVHKRNMIHRDLKPSNILIGSDGLIKISDFGISKLMTTEQQSLTGGIGTQKFMAPEILREEEYDEKVDVYSFGVVVFCILNGGNLPKISLVDIGNGKKSEIPNEFTEFSKILIDSCWNFDPKTRPSFDEIVKLLFKNDFKIVELSKYEVEDVRCFVESHKKKIPKL